MWKDVFIVPDRRRPEPTRRAFDASVSLLHRKLGTSSKEQYEVLRSVVEVTRVRSGQATLEAHTLQPGCGAAQSALVGNAEPSSSHGEESRRLTAREHGLADVIRPMLRATVDVNRFRLAIELHGGQSHLPITKRARK